MKFGKEKLKNIWFFYKKQIIVGAVLFAMGVFLLVQCATRTTYDINVYYAGDKYLTSDAQRAAGEAFAAVIKEEHAKTVGFITTVIGDKISVAGTEEEHQQYAMDYTGQKETMSDFNTRMIMPDTVICLLSPTCFAQASENTKTLRKLDEILDVLPEGTTENGYGVKLSSLPFYATNSILKAFPEGTVLCVKAPSFARSSDDYERQIAAFLDIVNYRRAE